VTSAVSRASAVLDADVLVPAVLRDTLLRAAARGLYRALWSLDILAEVERTLVIRLRIPEGKVQSLIAQMRRAFPDSEIAGYDALIESMANDLKDRHVVAAAQVAGAGVIVTRNIRHFPPPALEPLEIAVQHPDDFLVDLFDHNSRAMMDVIHDQAADLKHPPQTVVDIEMRLSRVTPTFVQRIRTARRGRTS
jgi:predicted nucleic acid-binding protein